jgi:hypothetical protein
VALSVPKTIPVIDPVVDNVIVAPAEISTEAVITKLEPTVKLQAFVPSPIITLEFAPETVQVPFILGVALFRILKILFAEVKFVGAVPDPFVLVPQLATAFIFPEPL